MDLPLLTAYEPDHLSERQPLPGALSRPLRTRRLDRRIAAAKAALGRRVLILGHHYQRDEVIEFADYTGDSLQAVAPGSASRPEAEFIVFCGVHFMAESADVLCARRTSRSSCPTSRRAARWPTWSAIDQLETCWNDLGQMGVTARTSCRSPTSTPAAPIKAFCGEHGGVVCTSSNAAAVLRWAWERGERVLFLPDQHLGRNTAYGLGVPLDEMVVWDPTELARGPDSGAVRRARIILWKGHCAVHTRFTVAADRARPRGASRASASSSTRRCPWEVAQAADDVGLDRVHHQAGQREPGRFGLGGGHRDPPGQPACARDRAGSDGDVRSIRSGACARRCSGCRRTTCCGCSRGWWRATCTTGSSSTRTRSTGRGWRSIACSRSRRFFPLARRAREPGPFVQISLDKEDDRGASTSPASVRLRRAGAAHRHADDADPSRQASRRLS